jgi:hypothetical protein
LSCLPVPGTPGAGLTLLDNTSWKQERTTSEDFKIQTTGPGTLPLCVDPAMKQSWVLGKTPSLEFHKPTIQSQHSFGVQNHGSCVSSSCTAAGSNTLPDTPLYLAHDGIHPLLNRYSQSNNEMKEIHVGNGNDIYESRKSGILNKGTTDNLMMTTHLLPHMNDTSPIDESFSWI